MTTFSTKDIITNDLSLHIEAFGKQQDPAIMLIAGAMAPARFWIDEFCQQLADVGHFVIRYDHRDMGLSFAVDCAKNPYTLNDLAADAIAVLDAYKIPKAHLVGHSMGGSIAQLMALDYPTRISALTLISSSVLTNASLVLAEQKAMEKTWQILGSNKPTTQFETSIDGFVASFTYLHGDIPVDHDVLSNYIKDLYARSNPGHIAWFEKFSAGIEPLHNHVKAQQNLPDRTSELKNIAVPVTIIHGQKDILALPRIIKEYCFNHIPHATMHVIPGMGHMILNRDLFRRIGTIIINEE